MVNGLTRFAAPVKSPLRARHIFRVGHGRIHGENECCLSPWTENDLTASVPYGDVVSPAERPFLFQTTFLLAFQTTRRRRDVAVEKRAGRPLASPKSRGHTPRERTH
ncbi:hypothetical protein Lfu02_03830 [Longispora fulva]|nr:hypothetical protein Lfu02_03830 [Longispora fulva]